MSLHSHCVCFSSHIHPSIHPYSPFYSLFCYSIFLLPGSVYVFFILDFYFSWWWAVFFYLVCIWKMCLPAPDWMKDWAINEHNMQLTEWHETAKKKMCTKWFCFCLPQNHRRNNKINRSNYPISTHIHTHTYEWGMRSIDSILSPSTENGLGIIGCFVCESPQNLFVCVCVLLPLSKYHILLICYFDMLFMTHVFDDLQTQPDRHSTAYGAHTSISIFFSFFLRFCVIIISVW